MHRLSVNVKVAVAKVEDVTRWSLHLKNVAHLPLLEKLREDASRHERRMRGGAVILISRLMLPSSSEGTTGATGVYERVISSPWISPRKSTC